ncbi:hypothetical protein TNIN_139931 [Trichonephila inaurata madagascariensis]|uniref:Uncharacterized protein n=1 Tax=Trichonephila inaurata madagascariensis TaxID=2747483 RepID=A0A8X6XS19_9ARAC|nr:hypothetical protein TNIN_139931 [Trichonephila inaurata madagascariensis]
MKEDPDEFEEQWNLYAVTVSWSDRFIQDGQWLPWNPMLVEDYPICFPVTVTGSMMDDSSRKRGENERL